MGLSVYLNIKSISSDGENEVNEQVWDWAGLTHNLSAMAMECGCYDQIWRPDEAGINCAGDLIPVLVRSLFIMKSAPERMRLRTPASNWGDYEGFLDFLQKYLDACKQWPDATIETHH